MGGMRCGSCGSAGRAPLAMRLCSTAVNGPALLQYPVLKPPHQCRALLHHQESGRGGKRLPTCSSPHAVLARQQPSSEFGCASTADTNPVLTALCESGRLLELNKRYKTNCYEQQINTA